MCRTASTVTAPERAPHRAPAAAAPRGARAACLQRGSLSPAATLHCLPRHQPAKPRVADPQARPALRRGSRSPSDATGLLLSVAVFAATKRLRPRVAGFGATSPARPRGAPPPAPDRALSPQQRPQRQLRQLQQRAAARSSEKQGSPTRLSLLWTRAAAGDTRRRPRGARRLQRWARPREGRPERDGLPLPSQNVRPTTAARVRERQRQRRRRTITAPRACPPRRWGAPRRRRACWGAWATARTWPRRRGSGRGSRARAGWRDTST